MACKTYNYECSFFLSFGQAFFTDADDLENDQMTKILNPEAFVSYTGIDDNLKELLKDVFGYYKTNPSRRSAELFETYAESLDIKEPSLSKHQQEHDFFQTHISAMETHRFGREVEDDGSDSKIIGTHVPLMQEGDVVIGLTMCDINNIEAAKEMITFPKVNYNKLNSMLDIEESLHMTVSVKGLPDLDADLDEEEGDSKVDPYYIVKGKDDYGKEYTFINGEKDFVKQENSATWNIALLFLDQDATIVSTASSLNPKKCTDLTIEIHNKNFNCLDNLIGYAEVKNICNRLTSARDQLMHRKQNGMNSTQDHELNQLHVFNDSENKPLLHSEMSVNFEYGDQEMAEAEPIQKILRSKTEFARKSL